MQETSQFCIGGIFKSEGMRQGSSEVVEESFGDVIENALMLFFDDLVDFVLQGGAVQEIRVVCAARC